MKQYPLALLNLNLACNGQRAVFFFSDASPLPVRALSLFALTGLQENSAKAVFEYLANAAG